jgi:DNA replication and repair protein RecF
VFIQALRLHGFRNLAPTVLEPGHGINVITGDNGQGKTNLLEAIYLIGTLRSFRTHHLAEVVVHGGDAAELAARVSRAGLDRTYELTVTGRRKAIRLDGKTPRSLADYFGDFNVVLFTPEDLSVPRGVPAGRRRFLDRSVFNRETTFLAAAQRYARALKSRNAVLKDGGPDSLLDVYDLELARSGARVLASRWRYLDEIGALFAAAYEDITHSGLAASLHYQSSAGLVPAQVAAVAETETTLHRAFSAARAKDRARRTTTVGPHTDDVRFDLAGRSVKAFASQGQTRAVVLAWKAAEMQLLGDRLHQTPVLLLDDVSSELDADRNRFLFALIARLGGQCFVTTTDPVHVGITANRLDFRIINGVLGRR